jgi:hypothetical protein
MPGSDIVPSRKAAIALSALLFCGSTTNGFVPHYAANRAFTLRSTVTEEAPTVAAETTTTTQGASSAQISAPPSEPVVAEGPAPAGNTEGQTSKVPVSVSLPMDRPNAFVSGTAPMPTFAKTGVTDPSKIPTSLPLDRQAAFVAGGLPHQAGGSVAFTTAATGTHAAPGGPVPATIPVDSWSKFHGGDVFAAGTPPNPTLSKTGGGDPKDLPTTLPMDRPNVFVSGTAPMPTFAKTGTTDPKTLPEALPMDRPNAFSAGGLPHQTKKF